jgi:titin
VYVEAPDIGSGAQPRERATSSPATARRRRLAARGNEVAGNYIGTDATAKTTSATPAWVSSDGLGINSIIGGTAEGASNVISGNDSYGLFLSSSDSKAEGNYIGTDVTGRVDLGNSDHGVAVLGSDNTVGGTVSGRATSSPATGNP